MTQTILGLIISISDYEATCDCNSKQYIHYMIAPLHCLGLERQSTWPCWGGKYEWNEAVTC